MKASGVVGIALGFALLVVVVLGSPMYVVDEREQVVVTRFNKPIRVVVGDYAGDLDVIRAEMREAANTDIAIAQGAGLYFKMPFVDVPERFPDTLLEYDAGAEEIVTKDKKTLSVDTFARWRIANPLVFRLRIRTLPKAQARLDDIIYSVMRQQLGDNDLIEIIRTTKLFTDFDVDEELAEVGVTVSKVMREELERGRAEIMATVTEQSKAQARRFGIEIIDVRVKRAELPRENLQAVFARMQAERERISKGYTSEGDRQAAIIKGETDRDVTIMLAEAQERAQNLRGEGDAEAIRIIAEAFSSDPDFYRYIRSLDVIKEATPAGSEIVIGLNSGLYKILVED